MHHCLARSATASKLVQTTCWCRRLAGADNFLVQTTCCFRQLAGADNFLVQITSWCRQLAGADNSQITSKLVLSASEGRIETLCCFAEPASAEPASASAVASKQHLEDTKVSQSLHPQEVSQPEPVPASQQAMNPRDDPQHPTSVAEDEVHTVIAHVNEADRYIHNMLVTPCLDCTGCNSHCHC